MEDRTGGLNPSRDAIRRIYENDTSTPIKGQRPVFHFQWDDAYSIFLKAQDNSTGQNMITYNSVEERHRIIQDTCQSLFDATADVDLYVERLEGIFSKLLSCQWRSAKLSTAGVTDGVEDVLRRLPQVPVPLPGPLAALHSGYFYGNEKTWESLKVASMVHRNLVCFVIYRLVTLEEQGFESTALYEALNHVGELVQQCVDDSIKDNQAAYISRWFLVRCYLWSFWQRARILAAYFSLAHTLEFGFYHGDEALRWMRNFRICPGLSLRAFAEQAAEAQKPRQMCGWKFELLRGETHCLGFDFRTLFHRFKQAFGALPALCHINQQAACDGQDWHECGRFSRTQAANQTMHDDTWNHSHLGEARVVMDEASYRSISGPRAVSISASDDCYLRYCCASEQTLAFSHVWSHGQGGRPHEGINRCLHQRYTRLAEQLGCDSYWIDSACIPEQDDLRKEAISHINGVFYRSKLVLVCDKDLMSLDISNLTTECQESLLAGVLLSDWNVRAWTMLEALKGRQHVAILCQGNRIAKYLDILRNVYHDGRIEVAVFALLLKHMLPLRYESKQKEKIKQESYPNDIPLESIGSWLSHRPASRADDYVTIWSLCLSQRRTPVKDAAEFWRQQKSVNSGFLLSSSDRLSEPGLSWAPNTPFALPKNRHNGLSIELFHRPQESAGTEILIVQPLGRACSLTSKASRQIEYELWKIQRKVKPANEEIVLLKPVSLMFSSAHDGAAVTPSASRSGWLLAVCDSDLTEKRPFEDPRAGAGGCYKWIWRGVYEWPARVPMPEFINTPELWIG
ncbi:hypothetical protein F5Y19DRAFT_476992 [Xylariaceae sp. FL1651]|nr:hypothetical protein F5Y19DRAFT_476992 [Xylariaceae sp. FL1651]